VTPFTAAHLSLTGCVSRSLSPSRSLARSRRRHGQLTFALRTWALLAKKVALQNSLAARALFSYFGRLTLLVFTSWRTVAHAAKDARLATLAAKLHFEGTLSWRTFAGWRELTKYVRWRYKQTQAGLARHFLLMERSTFSAWRGLIALMAALHANATAVRDQRSNARALARAGGALARADAAVLTSCVRTSARAALSREGAR
jgi:hypothetical protein